jgi:hypothetical protein
MKMNSYAYAAALAVLLASAPLANASDDKAAGPGTTVTGCVTTATDGKGFVLTEASKDMQAPPKTWTLVASDGVDLSKYANHKVEITSDKADKADSAAAPTAATAAGATADTKLKVKSVKDISNSCSQ